MIVFLCGEAVALMGTPKSEWGSKRHIAGPDLRWRNMMSRSLSVLMVGRMLIRNMEERRLENVSGDFGRCGEFLFSGLVPQLFAAPRRRGRHSLSWPQIFRQTEALLMKTPGHPFG